MNDERISICCGVYAGQFEEFEICPSCGEHTEFVSEIDTEVKNENRT